MFSRKIDPDGTRRVIDEALDAGINFIDTAESYTDSEEYIGRVLVGQRDRVFLATKVYTKRAANTPVETARPTSKPRSTTASSSFAPTASISISSIIPTRIHRSTKPSPRSTARSAGARSATLA